MREGGGGELGNTMEEREGKREEGRLGWKEREERERRRN